MNIFYLLIGMKATISLPTKVTHSLCLPITVYPAEF